MSEKENNKRIAKNTLLLYFRMIIVTLVSLYTARITLKLLGIEDFGIYNVVAGMVGFLGMLNGSLTSATQRFLSFELGKGDDNDFNRVFSMLVTIFVIISIILIIIAFSIGSWIVYDLIVIPDEKRHIAMWLYGFSVFTFVVSLLSIPYISAIVSNEKMEIYAYGSLLEASLKLLLVFILYVSLFDKLLTYGFLMMCVTFTTTFVYAWYCIKSIRGCKYHFAWDKELYNKLLNYTGWNMFGSVTVILNNQGQSLILNLFFGPLVNAAKAMADRINSIIVSFSSNFYMAVQPQIIKNYASGDHDYMHKLVNKSTKLSFYLLFLLTLPLILLMKKILVLWLGVEQVTDDMVLFSQLILVFSLVNVFEQPITAMIQATGRIKRYQIMIGLVTLLLLPICYTLFKFGAPAYFSLVALISIYAITQVLRLVVAKREVGLSITQYSRYVILPILLSTIPAILVSYYFYTLMPESIVGIIGSILLCTFSSLLSIFFFGLDKSERQIIVKQIISRFNWKIQSKK